MATQITGTKGSFDFLNHDIVEVAVDAQFKIGIAPQQIAVVKEKYHIDRTQQFPQTPPSWLMSSAFLASLVSDGNVTVQ
jgi:hypothetical protein